MLLSPLKREGTPHTVQEIDTRWGPLERNDTKLLAHGPFLELLRDQGRHRGSDWLTQHAPAIGQHATLDVQAYFT